VLRHQPPTHQPRTSIQCDVVERNGLSGAKDGNVRIEMSRERNHRVVVAHARRWYNDESDNELTICNIYDTLYSARIPFVK